MTPIHQFLCDAGWCVASDVGAKNGPVEARALRRSWLAALAEASLTEEQARDLGRGLWMRAGKWE